MDRGSDIPRLENCSARCLASIHDIDPHQWDALFPGDNPFVRHVLLAAMEDSGCAIEETGWRPAHLVLEAGSRLVAAAPLYLKAHSYGEFVFDWSWASACERAGLDYYPKALSAVPFMPCPGPRVGMLAGLDPLAVARSLLAAMQAICRRHGLSGWHLLFPDAAQTRLFNTLARQDRWLHREAVQFRWRHRGYRDFDDFLSGFRAGKRKTLRRERRRVQEQGVSLERIPGASASDDDWAAFHRCYVATYARRSGHAGYLNRAFFEALRVGMPEQLMLVMARRGREVVGNALFAHDAHTLYGRYWGALDEVDCLHFETCLYQGIEYCIERGLRRFDPGTQGEHKLVRGFEPVRSHSFHWVADPRLRAAIAEYLLRERQANDQYFTAARAALPFHRG